MKKGKIAVVSIVLLLLFSGFLFVNCDDSICIDGKCPTCSGRGYLNYTDGRNAGECHSCKGTGLHSKCGGKGCSVESGENGGNIILSFTENHSNNLVVDVMNPPQLWNISSNLDIQRLKNAGYTEIRIKLSFSGRRYSPFLATTLNYSIRNNTGTIYAENSCSQPFGVTSGPWHNHELTANVNIDNFSNNLVVRFVTNLGRVDIAARTITVEALR